MAAFLLKDMTLFAIALILFVIVMGAAILMYRVKIGNLIDRLWSRPEADKPLVAAQSAGTATFPTPHGIFPESKTASAVAENMLAEITATTPDLESRARALATLAANWLLRAEFESRSRTIYQSKLDALTALRQRGPHALDEHYRVFMVRVEERRAEIDALGVKTSFEDWVQFLTGDRFPYVNLDAGIASITDRGDALAEFISKAPALTRPL